MPHIAYHLFDTLDNNTGILPAEPPEEGGDSHLEVPGSGGAGVIWFSLFFFKFGLFFQFLTNTINCQHLVTLDIRVAIFWYFFANT